MNNLQISFGIIIATRNIFNAKLAVEARANVLDKLDKMGFGTCYIASWKKHQTGNIEGYEDAVKCADYFKKNAEKIDGIIVVLTQFRRRTGSCK